MDPFEAKGVPGLKDYHLDADLVLVSHEHFDHNYREAVTLSGRTCPFKVEIIEAFHDDCGGTDLGPNKIIILDDGKIADIGNHESLLANSSIYQEIYQSQLQSNTRGEEQLI